MRRIAKIVDWWVVTLSFVAFLAIEYAVIRSLLTFLHISD